MLTVERAEALQSLYWDDVITEIDFKIEAATRQLRTISPEKLQLIQERIRTLEELKSLPQTIIDHRGSDNKE